MNKHWKFWTTFGSIINFVILFLFLMFMGIKEEMVFKKEYCLFLMPILIYNMFQCVVNYGDLIEDN